MWVFFQDRAWGDHWDEAVGEKMELNPHIPKPDPPKPEEEKKVQSEDKKAEDKKDEDNKKAEEGKEKVGAFRLPPCSRVDRLFFFFCKTSLIDVTKNSKRGLES